MSEKIQPISNPELRKAMEAMHAGQNGREEQMVTLNLLLIANLLSPVNVMQEPGEEAQVQFMLLSTEDGRAFLPAFTDLEQLKLGFPDDKQKTLVLTFADYARMILQDNAAEGLVVNAFGASLTLERPLVEFLDKVQQDQEKNAPPVVS
ncbi:MAG: SseB family protein [Ruminococcaceae bacterium]|nr:SseB family protein [Oscillospiraceae bacterium]